MTCEDGVWNDCGCPSISCANRASSVATFASMAAIRVAQAWCRSRYLRWRSRVSAAAYSILSISLLSSRVNIVVCNSLTQVNNLAFIASSFSHRCFTCSKSLLSSSSFIVSARKTSSRRITSCLLLLPLLTSRSSMHRESCRRSISRSR